MIRKICPKAQIFEWEIPSSTGRGKYTVHKHPGRLTCTCMGFIYYQRCKHIDLISAASMEIAAIKSITSKIEVCFFNGTSDMSVKYCPGCGSKLLFDYSELEIGNEVI